MELEKSNATGLKLLKKKVDLIKGKIEEELTDEEVKQIFLDPSNLQGFDLKKLTKYMESNIFQTLEDRLMEAESIKDPQEQDWREGGIFWLKDYNN